MTRSGRAPRWLLLLALVGCRRSDASPGEVTAAAATPAPTTAPATAVEIEVPLVPLLGKAALDARVHAQRSALGAEAPLFEDERGQQVPWIRPSGPLPDEPSIDDDLLDALPGSSGLGGGDAAALAGGPRPSGNSLGLFEPLEGDPRALAHFHAALRALERGEDRKVRVLVWGASHTEADIYPQYLRSYLQDRFGNGGHGFVMPAQPWKGYGHVEVSVEGFAGWRTDHAQRDDDDDDRRFGLLGASIATRSAKAFGRVVQQAGVVGSHYELWYVAQPRGGSLAIIADGRTVHRLDTRARRVAPGYHAFSLPEAEHTIELRPIGDGDVRILGLVIERDDPGVVVDTLGIRGTRAANLLEWDEALWRDNVQHRAPDLVVLAFGTNEATDDRAIEVYESDLRAVLDRQRRAAPRASCLLVGPGDFPLPLPDGTLAPRPRVSQIIEVQSRVAAEHGCGFWDLRAFMGGELAMLQWVRAEPPMAQPDLIHLTRRGYVRMGMALVDALMTDFDHDDPLRGR